MTVVGVRRPARAASPAILLLAAFTFPALAAEEKAEARVAGRCVLRRQIAALLRVFPAVGPPTLVYTRFMSPAGVERRRFSTDEYHRMIEVGLLCEDDRVELLAGEIWEAAAIRSPHAGCVNRLAAWFSERLARRAIVSVQNPVGLDGFSEPEPDLTLLRPRGDFYAECHPTPADVLLLIEVCDASWAFDRRVKLPLYARAAVREVWLIHLEGRALHVFRRPERDRFLGTHIVRGEDSVSPEALPDLVLSMHEIVG